ncbi:hypothetical protein AALO_G00219150 [Alosa alosa]|uniref:Uncharacterized protein n=1 Tax=Alosa alosa TaxID=278164 RepID=A0AAV6FXN8_9TELE|nr:hypothetical protein AALO_G00219150 [Alosa alosa]
MKRETEEDNPVSCINTCLIASRVLSKTALTMTGVFKLFAATFLALAATLFRMVDCVGGLMYVQGPLSTSYNYQTVTDVYEVPSEEQHLNIRISQR